MTQNTQTTAERIREIIDSTVEDFGLETETRDTIASSKIIAAEIDRLTAEVASKQETIDMLLEDERDAFRHERAQLETQLAEARAEVERLRPAATNWTELKAWVEREAAAARARAAQGGV